MVDTLLYGFPKLCLNDRLSAVLRRRALGEHVTPAVYGAEAMEGRGLPYSRALAGHAGCVNAITFAPVDGRLLASGSDDRRVLLWASADHRVPQGPVRHFTGHVSNVFCTAWAPDRRHLFSAGNEGKILRYDVEHGPGFLDEFSHDDAVHQVSMHAEDPNVFVSASHDFTMKLWDVRAGQVPQGSIVGLDAFNAVALSPADRHTFLSCDGSAVAMWDMRKSFGPTVLPSLDAARQAKQRVLRHYMAVCRHHSGVMFLPEISGLAFNRRGTHFVCSVWKAVPLLYAVDCETPLTAFHSPNYSNKVTQKTPSFAGQDDQYVMCGSDDWGVYLWRIAEAKRQTDDSTYRLRLSHSKRRAYAHAAPRTLRSHALPRRRVQTNAEFAVDGPAHVLRGHQSIVNAVAWHPTEPLIASAGVEKRIRLWSPWPLGEEAETVRTPQRDFTRRRIAILREALAEEGDVEPTVNTEANTFELFDFYTARMESESDNSDAMEPDSPPPFAGRPPPPVSDSEVDWDAWRSDSSERAAGGLGPTPSHHFFSSSDEEDGARAPDSPERLSLSRPQRRSLSLAFDTATLLQQLAEPPPSPPLWGDDPTYPLDTPDVAPHPASPSLVPYPARKLNNGGVAESSSSVLHYAVADSPCLSPQPDPPPSPSPHSSPCLLDADSEDELLGDRKRARGVGTPDSSVRPAKRSE